MSVDSKTSVDSTSLATARRIAAGEYAAASLWLLRLRRLQRNRFGMVMILICISIIVVALLAPILAPYDPLDLDPAKRLYLPSREHWFGTDEMGRDIFSRIIYGSRISLRIAVLTVTFSVFLGVTLGTIAGYVGGRTDQLVMRVTDIFLAFPSLVLAMALSASLGPSVENAAIALGLVWWPGYARLIRGGILAVKNEPFVEASQAMGASHFRIVRYHILPNVIDPILVRMTLTGGNAILMGSALSFIGLGAQPPTPEWGLMVALARRFLIEAWWYSTIIGLAIFITVLFFTLAADALQEAVYPEGE